MATVNRTRRTVAILSATRREALDIAYRRGIGGRDVCWPPHAGTLARAQHDMEVIVPPSFAQHPEFEGLADWLQRRLNPTRRLVGVTTPVPGKPID